MSTCGKFDEVIISVSTSFEDQNISANLFSIGSQIENAKQEFIQARNPGLINSAVD